jgi:hypothetical protein
MSYPTCRHDGIPSRTTTGVRDVAALLDRAADYLDRHGWTPRGMYGAHNGCTNDCQVHRTHTYAASVTGAIRAALYGRAIWFTDHTDPDDLHTYTAACEWFHTYLLAHGHAGRHASVFDWQTAPGRTAADVTGALHAAAHAYRHHASRRTAA